MINSVRRLLGLGEEKSEYERGREYVRTALQELTNRHATMAVLEQQASNPFDSGNFEKGMRDEIFAQWKPAELGAAKDELGRW